MKSRTPRFFLILCSFVILLPAAARAQQKTLNSPNSLPLISTLPLGKARLTLGKISKIVDLSKNVSGCLSVYDGTDPKGARSSYKNYLKVVDKARKDDYLYIVLLASGQGNCNVQGMCGAATDYSLIWLKLDQKLTVADKKSVTVESCRGNIELKKPELSETDYQNGFKLALQNKTLAVEFEENRDSEPNAYKYFRLTYNAAEPEKGFTVVDEKRSRPSN